MADAGTERRFSAVLLAAGLSTRMGSFKPLLPFGDTSLYAFQLNQLADIGADEIIVVVGSNADKVLEQTPTQVVTVFNPGHLSGRASSVRVGVAATQAGRDTLIASADQPRPAWLLRRLIGRHFAGHHPISVPTYQGRNGHPPIFSNSLRGELLAAEEQVQGLKAVVRRHGDRINRVEMDSEWALVNLNHPHDYERALALDIGERKREITAELEIPD